MDNKEASNDAEIQVKPTWRTRMTSSLRLPVSKSETSRNCRQENKLSLDLDETTRMKGTDNDLASDYLLMSDSRVAVPETGAEDNDAVENGTSNENYIRLANDDDEDQSWAGGENDIDKHQKSCVDFETSKNSPQTLGRLIFAYSHVSLSHQKIVFLPLSYWLSALSGCLSAGLLTQL